MGRPRECWGASKHEQNGVPDGLNLYPKTKLAMEILRRLVQYHDCTNKWAAKGNARDAPNFCVGCVNHIKSEPIPLAPKRARTETNEVPAHGCQTEGSHVFITGVEGEFCTDLLAQLKRLSIEERAVLAFYLGQCEKESVRQSTVGWTRGSKTFDTLTSLSPSPYLESMNQTLTGFLHGLGATIPPPGEPVKKPPFSIEKPSDIYKLCKVSEACSALTTPISVLPYHFKEVVLIYNLTRSRFAVDVLASTSPCGAYGSVRSLCGDSSQSVPMPDGDILVAFDNNQVLKKTWKISLKSKFASHVITMVLAFEVDKDGDLQTFEALKPESWFPQGREQLGLSSERVEKVRNIDLTSSEVRKLWWVKFLYPVLLKYLAVVSEEQDCSVDGSWSDAVDKKLESDQKNSLKACSNCGQENLSVRARKCPGCKEPLQKLSTNHASSAKPRSSYTGRKAREVRALVTADERGAYSINYEDVPRNVENDYSSIGIKDNHAGKPPTETTVLEPIYLNPGSYDSLASIFRTIGKKAGVRQLVNDGKREWVCILCDGSPFVIGMRIMKKYFYCKLCGATGLVGVQKCVSHIRDRHAWEDEKSIEKLMEYFGPEFGWILLLPGPGHVEMNMVKAYVKVVWPVFWETLVEIFNFKSPAAKRVAERVSDHHKGWTLCRIAFEAIAKELLVPFVRTNPDRLTPEAYFKFAMNETNDANYAFMFDAVFELLAAILIYRAGIRAGDTPLMLCGRALFSKVWCARSHPHYRELDMFEAVSLELMPQQLLDFVLGTMSMNCTGNSFSAQGADFRLEEINRAIQHWIPAIPTDKDWMAACVNHSKMQQMRNETLQQIHLLDPKSRQEKQPEDISCEVLAFRSIIRAKEYLLRPQDDKPHVSLKGEPLHDNLADFCASASEKRAQFIDAFLKHYSDKTSEGPVPFDTNPVFVTAAEAKKFADISQRKISEIISIIRNKLENIADGDTKVQLDADLSDLLRKRAKKQEYVELYQTVVDFIENDDCAFAAPSDDSADEDE